MSPSARLADDDGLRGRRKVALEDLVTPSLSSWLQTFASCYRNAFLFCAPAFFVVFDTDRVVTFFFSFFLTFLVPLELDGLTRLIRLAPIGEPRPVQASQPGPALKPPFVPEMMSLKPDLLLAA